MWKTRLLLNVRRTAVSTRLFISFLCRFALCRIHARAILSEKVRIESMCLIFIFISFVIKFYEKGYTVDCLGNMVGGRKTFYINQPIEVLAQLATQSIEANEGVWLGCEVSKRFSAKHGIEDLQM